MNLSIPGTRFEHIDESATQQVQTTSYTSPVMMAAFASPKGPEDFRQVKKESNNNLFTKLYGTDPAAYAKYGQAFIQSARAVEEGGILLCKRVVANDATLANVGFIAKLKIVNVQKLDSEGNLVYIDSVTGAETTVVEGNTACMIDTCIIKFVAKSIQSAKTIDEVIAGIETEVSINDPAYPYAYPLWVIADNGRGLSKKKMRLSPEYTASKTLPYMKYTVTISEEDDELENFIFTLNPDIIENDENKSMETVINTYSNQLVCKQFEIGTKQFIEKVAEISGNTKADCYSQDIIFGKEKKTKTDLVNISIEYNELDAINFSYIYGIQLENGSNGSFGDYPINTPEYEQRLLEFFNGNYTNDIYDLDNYKIDLLIDANYPASVKRAIEALANFREDLFYIRDMGLNLKDINSIKRVNASNGRSRYSGTYHLSYDVIDPYTKKQIPVTVGYSLTKLLINHFVNGRSRPIAGQLHNMVIDEAIKGTVNFIPKKTPLYDQKDELIDERVNYAGYYDGKLVLETLYTSQEELTQLSYISNVIAIQEVLKAVRTKCPKIRYSFTDGKDLIKYKQDVQAVLDIYSSNFVKLKMVYLEDPTMMQNKVFYAAIQAVYKNFVQAEYFKIYSLSE